MVFTLLKYVRTINISILVEIGVGHLEQDNGIESTEKALTHLFDILLLWNQPRHHLPLFHQKYDYFHPQWCLIPLISYGLKLIGRIFLLRISPPRIPWNKKWVNLSQIHHHKKYYGLSCEIQMQSAIFKHQRLWNTPHHAPRYKSYTTHKLYPNIKLNKRWNCQ